MAKKTTTKDQDGPKPETPKRVRRSAVPKARFGAGHGKPAPVEAAPIETAGEDT